MELPLDFSVQRLGLIPRELNHISDLFSQKSFVNYADSETIRQNHGSNLTDLNSLGIELIVQYSMR